MSEHRLIIVMGVSGSGKSSVGRLLAEKLGIPFYDGDDFHPAANVEKMQAGRPLDDADRWPWLEAINEHALREVEETSVVIACSALKESYREVLRERLLCTFVFLKGGAALILERINEREGHFMPPELLESQFAALEEPEDAIVVSIEQGVEDVVKEVSEELGRSNLK